MPNTVDDYGVLLDNERGQRVLANMLLEGGFFEYNKTPEEQAVENFLKTILAKTGHYPIGEQVNSMERALKYVSGFRKRQSVKQWILNLLRLKKEN